MEESKKESNPQDIVLAHRGAMLHHRFTVATIVFGAILLVFSAANYGFLSGLEVDEPAPYVIVTLALLLSLYLILVSSILLKRNNENAKTSTPCLVFSPARNAFVATDRFGASFLIQKGSLLKIKGSVHTYGEMTVVYLDENQKKRKKSLGFSIEGKTCWKEVSVFNQ